METFDVQSIVINAPFEKVFGYIADAKNLHEWTSAFESVFDGRASMRTPNGAVKVALTVKASTEAGTVDWIMKFPNGDTATACSRVVPAGKSRCIYSFIFDGAARSFGTIGRRSPTIPNTARRVGDASCHFE
jgi:hypothetical protein